MVADFFNYPHSFSTNSNNEGNKIPLGPFVQPKITHSRGKGTFTKEPDINAN